MSIHPEPTEDPAPGLLGILEPWNRTLRHDEMQVFEGIACSRVHSEACPDPGFSGHDMYLTWRTAVLLLVAR